MYSSNELLNSTSCRRWMEYLSGPCCCTHGAVLERILENVIATKTLLNEQNKNVQKMVGSDSMQNLETRFETVPSKPFRLYRKLLEYESSLRESLNAKKELETVFYVCGGITEKEAIKRGLTKLFSDELARKCSWTGRKNNFPLKDLVALSLLKDAVRKRFRQLTDKDFETIVATWFRQAELRYLRKETKA